MKVKIRCLDCHEENNWQAKRCVRCGRLLDDARNVQARRFEEQHQDAPGIVKKPKSPGNVW